MYIDSLLAALSSPPRFVAAARAPPSLLAQHPTSPRPWGQATHPLVRTAQTPLGKVTLSLPPSLSPSRPTAALLRRPAPASPSFAGPRLPCLPPPARAGGGLAFLRRPAQARAGLARLFLVKKFSQHRCDMTRAWHVSLLGRHNRLRRSQNAVSSPSCWSRYRHRLRSLLAPQPVELRLAQGQCCLRCLDLADYADA